MNRVQMVLGRLEKAIFWALLALLVWLPVPLGSRRDWSVAVMAVAVCVLLAAWLALWASDRVRIAAPLRKAWPVFLLLGLFFAHQAITVIALPWEWVVYLSPESARMHALRELLGQRPEAITISLDPYATRMSLVKTFSYAGVFFLFLAVVNNRLRVQTAARVIVFAAVAHAVYAVIMHLTEASNDHFFMRLAHGDSAQGFYTNRNLFAGMLEMTLAIGIGLLIAGLSDRSARSWRQVVVHLIEWILSPKMLLRLSLCILVIALTTTHSRMGNTAFFSALLIAGVIGIALSRHATRNVVVLLVSLVIIDLAIVGSWFGVEKLARRLEATTAEDVREREEPGMHAAALIRDYPVFGSGAGSFEVAFPRYQPAVVDGLWDHAHNDYAEIAADTGLVGLALLGLVVVLSLGAALRAHWERRDPLMRGMSFASIMGITSILIHSWVDFNLQVPANAALFMVLLALGWISLHLGRD